MNTILKIPIFFGGSPIVAETPMINPIFFWGISPNLGVFDVRGRVWTHTLQSKTPGRSVGELEARTYHSPGRRRVVASASPQCHPHCHPSWACPRQAIDIVALALTDLLVGNKMFAGRTPRERLFGGAARARASTLLGPVGQALLLPRCGTLIPWEMVVCR